MARRFYISRQGRAWGPYPAADAFKYIGGDLGTPLCPDDTDPTQRASWQPARVFPEFRAMIKRPPRRPRREPVPIPDLPPPPPSRSGLYAAVAAAGLCAALWRGLQIPPAAEAPAPPPRGGEEAVALYVPACGASVGELAGGAAEISSGGDGTYEVDFGDVRLSFDEESGETRVDSAAAAKLFDLRVPCP